MIPTVERRILGAGKLRLELLERHQRFTNPPPHRHRIGRCQRVRQQQRGSRLALVDPQVEKSSNNAFEKPAVEALKKWKFKPAKQDGNPVAIKVSIPIKFVAET